MNIHKLWDYKEFINVNGVMMNYELISRVQNSLTVMQIENHFTHIQYWGQIYGEDKDYHIAVGITNDAILNRKYLYSTDFKFWGLLPRAKKKHKLLALLSFYPFRGDPNIKVKILDEGLEDTDPDRCQIMTEEARLTATISNISEEAEICARGQLIKNPDGTVVINPNFYGLTPLEAKHQKSYLHVRAPQHRWNTNLLTRPDYNYSMDCLDSIDQDIPGGCWNVSVEQNASMVYVRSLYWQGMTYFHKVKTGDAGWMYFGTGRKSLDVPFNLNF